LSNVVKRTPRPGEDEENLYPLIVGTICTANEVTDPPRGRKNNGEVPNKEKIGIRILDSRGGEKPTTI